MTPLSIRLVVRDILIVLICVSVVCALLSCGKKGRPKPPEMTAPRPVKYLQIEGRVDSVLLSWQAPVLNAKGDDLNDLSAFHVKRSPWEKDEAPDFDVIGEVVVEPSEGEDSEVPAEARSSLYSYADEQVQPGNKYQYVVVPVNEKGVEGMAGRLLRVTFTGESSVVENVAAGF